MKIVKNIVVFLAFLALSFILVMCGEKIAGFLPLGGAAPVVYGAACVLLFIVLFRKQGIRTKRGESRPGPEDPEAAEEDDPGSRERRLEQIRKGIRDRKKQEGKSLI